MDDPRRALVEIFWRQIRALPGAGCDLDHYIISWNRISPGLKQYCTTCYLVFNLAGVEYWFADFLTVFEYADPSFPENLQRNLDRARVFAA